ncbi:hypothetical protein GCM10009641_71520 [Mycobacterium cookii]|uniref:DUF4232 domain-containing protein n=1 Tax=Mycobacterium cookii TaxID=1775 RepID=UPI0013D06DF2|nr:DUF4232 domain-containing protein [Mycobacterium cookii]MCV7331386.1 DUF4232 domain-containing protein [Mycobacterium cookii]
MKPSGTLAAALVVATSTLVLPASAHAGGPPNNGDGGGGGSAAVTPGSCADGDLAVTNGPIESANTLRRVVVSFKNTSSNMCMLVGYPDANLVTAAGGVLVHVEPEPANAAHVLHLNPGDVATSAVQASALDINGSGNPCPREGTLVVTAPKGSVAHTLPIALPICHATISSVD